jgi:hypothetical protein
MTQNEGVNKKSVELVISYDSKITPNILHYNAIGLPVRVRETCSGIVIRGAPEQVKSSIEKLRKLDPYKIFVKARGSNVGSNRIYRGFLQMEGEYKTLPLISYGLKEVLSKDQIEKPKTAFIHEAVVPEKILEIFEKTRPSSGKENSARKAYIYPIISKYFNFETFWIVRDGESKQVVVVATSKQEVIEKAEKKGYKEFSKEIPTFSVASSDGKMVASGRLIICQYAPSAIDVDAVLLLHKDDSVTVPCPLADVCKSWCPYGEVDLWASNSQETITELFENHSYMLSPGDERSETSASTIHLRYKATSDRKRQWRRRWGGE